jgi:DNA-binding MarR family transcriptional regulator
VSTVNGTDAAGVETVGAGAAGPETVGAEPAGLETAGPKTPGPGAASDTAASDRAAPDPDAPARIWRNLGAMVLEQNEGRKKITEALGMSFFRAKALRRIAARPSSMSELATRLSTDRPYLTLVVDDLEKRGLVERRQHPTDRRCKIVSVTPAGQAAADLANAILGTPHPALAALPPEDLAALDRIAAALAAAVRPRDGAQTGTDS